MRKLFELVGDLASGDPRLLIALGVVLAIVIGGVVFAKVTKARRMRSKARIVRRRD